MASAAVVRAGGQVLLQVLSSYQAAGVVAAVDEGAMVFVAASRNVDLEAVKVGVVWANDEGILAVHKGLGLLPARHVAVRFCLVLR